MEVKPRLQEVFRRVFDDEEIELTESMTSDDIEDWDSLSHMELILAIEREFEVRFTTSQINETENVGSFIKIIEAKLNEA